MIALNPNQGELCLLVNGGGDGGRHGPTPAVCAAIERASSSKCITTTRARASNVCQDEDDIFNLNSPSLRFCSRAVLRSG